MKYIYFLSILVAIQLNAQNFNEHTKNIIGTFHTKNSTINGLAVGAFPNMDEDRFVKTNGLRLEIPGLGILAPLGNGFNLKENNTEAIDEIVNGINISGGTIGSFKYNGMTVGLIAQFGKENNGIAVAGMWNAMNISNGMQVSTFLNETITNNGIQAAFVTNKSINSNGIQIGAINSTEKMYGIQIGLFNTSKQTKGLQIGAWNVNEKRKLPLLNWNF